MIVSAPFPLQQSLTLLSTADSKVRAASSINPNALVGVAPCLAFYARRTAALIDHSHAAACVRIAVVAFAVVRGARDGLNWAATVPITASSATAPYHEVGSASAIYPDRALVIAPGLTLNAGRAAALIHHPHAAPGVCIAIVAFPVVRGTGDGLTASIPIASTSRITAVPAATMVAAAQPEVGAASTIHPDSLIVISPGLSLDTGRSAALIRHPDTVLSGCGAKVPFSVIGCAGNRTTVLFRDTALRVQANRTQRHKRNRKDK